MYWNRTSSNYVICLRRTMARNKRDNQTTFTQAVQWIPFYKNPPKAVISPTSDLGCFCSCAFHQLQVVKLWIRTRISRVILVVLQYTFAHDVCYDLSVGADQDHRSFGWLMLNSIFSARVKDIVYFSANESYFLHLFFMFL